ncbi:MAG: family 43 glycosylhydrolase [Humibacter sp.]
MTHSLYYQPADHWFGDCMPYAENGVFSLFHQRDTRKPGPFGEPFGWALARTSDFVSYEDLGEVIPGGGDDAQDQFIFAGSVFKANDTYYALYTGYNRDYPEQGKASQVLMIATSSDLVNWTKTNRELVVPQPGYDPDDWRDPFVLWDDEAAAWRMILGARALDGAQIITGRTVSFTSTDLDEWVFDGDFYAPGLYSMHEMPDVFKMGDWWYLLTTEYSDKSKTVYAMSRSLSGPWIVPDDDAFDGRAYYAARSAADGDARYLFGWVPTKEGNEERRPWEWGGTLVVHEVVQRTDGTLGVRPPQSVLDAFAQHERLPDATLESADAVTSSRLTGEAGGLYRLDATFRVAQGTKSFSLRLFEDETTGDGYEFVFDVAHSSLSFDRRPNYPWYRYDNKGLERPLTVESGVDHRMTLIVDDTIATLYVDGVALTARAYERPGRAIVASVLRGGLTITDVAIARGLAVRGQPVA